MAKNPAEAQKHAPATPEEAAPAIVGGEVVRCRVVTNYGSHRPGARIDVPRSLYVKRFRKADNEGKFSFPVLISEEDEAAQVAEAKAAEEAKLASQRHLDDRDRTEGWAEYQKRSLEMVKTQRIESQQAQHAAMLGTPITEKSQEQVAADYRKKVSAARTG